MFSHIMLGSNDVARSKIFYDALFEAIGASSGKLDDHGISYYHNGTAFVVRPPLDGNSATHGNGSTIGFSLASPEEVKAWHDAGVGAGGRSVEDPPGVRRNEFGAMYLAYLRDPDGNKLCGLHRLPSE